MPGYKTYFIDFYRTLTEQDDDGTAVADFLQLAVQDANGITRPIEIDDEVHIIARLTFSSRKFRGEFCRIRRDDLPMVGDELGNEEELALRERQGLVEKNHFVFEPDRLLLVWQVNGNGSHISRLAKYLTRAIERRTQVEPILEGDALAHMMRGDVQLSKIDVSFALPTNPDLYPTSATSRYFLDLLDGIGAESITVHASANAPGRGARRALNNRVKVAMREFSQMPGARKVKVESDGFESMDLIAQRLRTEINVRMRGRYPNRQGIFQQMSEAIAEVSDELDVFFGEQEGRLE